MHINIIIAGIIALILCRLCEFIFKFIRFTVSSKDDTLIKIVAYILILIISIVFWYSIYKIVT